MQETKKNKIINDPIYGFITLERGIIFDLIEHPFFQRLRRITQLGLSYLVYPGAYHTRFHHALGCMFLMEKAILQIKNKGHKISLEEEEALKIAKSNGENEAFIIGGGQIYKLALESNLIDRIYLTRIHHSFDGDTFFPELSSDWEEIKREDCFKDDNHKYDYSFIVLENK